MSDSKPSLLTGTQEDPTSVYRRRVLWAILLLAAVLRVWGATGGLPFSYYGDELHFVKRAMSLGTGDLNPHWFHKPAFLMYVLLGCYGAYFAIGRVTGMFTSVAAFGAHFLNDMGPFVLIGRMVVVLFGVATVYIVYRIAMEGTKSFTYSAASALAASVLFPMVAGSQVVKADVPSGFMIAASFLAYLVWLRELELRWLAVSALLAGVAMGTKYYGIILLPGYVLSIVASRFAQQLPWKLLASRTAMILLLFGVGFFVVSPYNLIDSTWPSTIAKRVGMLLGRTEAVAQYDPDTQIEFDPTLASSPEAAVHLLSRAIEPKSLGIGFALLLVVGWALLLSDEKRRVFAFHVTLPVATFVALAASMGAFHISWRHFNAVLPLVCTLVPAGAVGLARVFGSRAPRWLPAILFLVPVLIGLTRSVAHDVKAHRPDSRTAAYRWIARHIDPEDMILLDEYGPILQPSPIAVQRLKQRLAALPADEAFTQAQFTRLDLLEKYPGPEAMNYEELAHQWWLNREFSDAELVQSWKHRDMGNPLKSRVPRTLQQYRRSGFRYVVTNARARKRYFETPGAEESFPSFYAFYTEIGALSPIVTFAPEDLGGKGPKVWVYDLSTLREVP